MAARKLEGKVAVVTGASKGIGAEIARQFAAEGAAVLVNYASSRAGADGVVADIVKRDGKAVAVQGDVAKRADVERIFAEAKRHFGRVDILVNNAGVYEFAPIEEVTEEQFHRQYGTNVLGLLLATQAAVRQFDAKAGGVIINISSTASTFAPPNTAVYSGTKGAVDTITRVLSKELGPRNIRVNAINPGMVETEGVAAMGETAVEFKKQVVAQTPLGRVGQVQDIAPTAVYLASSDSSWITGETFAISGGLR
jgi:3-oxoacyl-[acyl-carrier protein] reductase